MFDRSWVRQSVLFLALVTTPITMSAYAEIGSTQSGITDSQIANGPVAQVNQNPQQQQQELFRQQQRMQREQLQDFRLQQQFNRQQMRLQQQQQQQLQQLQQQQQQQQQQLQMENYRSQQENR